MRDIEDLNDIKTFVDGFYAKVRKDKLLAPVFATRIQPDDWGKHLNRMYDFWNTVLFFQPIYKGNPFSKHMDLPVNPDHFVKWISLFTEALDENFQGPKADETKKRAGKMAVLFMSKIQRLKDNSRFRPLV